MDIRLRDSGAGALQFQLSAGTMVLNQLDGTGKVVQKFSFPNFYGRGAFFDFIVETVGDQLRLYSRDGDFVETLKNMPPPGDTRFIAVKPDDLFRVDDCLFTETAKAATEDARWAFDKIKEVESRSYQPLLTEWYDRFDDRLRTQGWWDGGQNAPGDFKTGSNDPAHRTYLEMSYQPGNSWRMFRYIKEFYTFGLGNDRRTYFDSSDSYIRVQVRIVKSGTAYIAARTAPSLGGGTLDGFFLELTRDEIGNYSAVTRGFTRSYQPVYFSGKLPPATDNKASDWVSLLIVTYQNKVAFFANGRFLAAAEDVPILSGTVAIGVEKDTIANFDELELRDVSPETR
jgi:hypothetical protein